jgi:hypothetical protein
MSFDLSITLLAVWMGSFGTVAQTNNANLDTSASGRHFLEHVVYHSQGWGEMGIDTCAHAPGKEAMPLRVTDRQYECGLGVHAPGETTVELGGRFARFEAAVGVQRQNGNTGSVVFKVFVDDKEVFDSGVMREDTPAKPVQIPLEGASEMRLVVTDAGDGITCDCANWLMPRLVPNPAVSPQTAPERADVAPFARALTWDAERMDGVRAGRLDEFPAEDLFLESPVVPGEGGVYTVPTNAAGVGCIGLEWLERRRLDTLELQYAEDSHVPPSDTVELQGWRMATAGGSPGGSRWQGRWEPLEAALDTQHGRWTWRIGRAGSSGGYVGFLKVRWVFRDAEHPVSIQRIAAYTLSRWETTDLYLQMDSPDSGGRGVIEMYNGEIVSPEGMPYHVEWDLAAPLRVKVRGTLPRKWSMADRTVLRFQLLGAAFGVAVDDVAANGYVFVPHAGLFVSTEPVQTTLEECKRRIAEQRTILDEVRDMPDQTLAQAVEHVHRPDADFGPTMLSLACDNHKFIVEREGTITFDNAQEVADSFEHPYPRPYSCKVIPQFGSGGKLDVRRHLQGDWLPIPVIELTGEDVAYRQRTFVAPSGDPVPPNRPAWLNEKPLCVAEYTMENRADAPADATLTLSFLADAEKGVMAQVMPIEHGCRIEKEGRLLAVLRIEPEFPLSVEATEGRACIRGSLPPETATRCAAFIPGWEADSAELPGVAEIDGLVRKTETYWQDVMAGSADIVVPDPLLTLLIRASRVHCMIAARNDHGERVAPWIASLFYGPLESEGHSIIRGMMFTGHEDFARRALEYYIARYDDRGFLTTGYTVMGTGWHLWALGEFYALTRDEAWMRRAAPDVARVCTWVMAQLDKTKHRDPDGQKVPGYGLMPPAVMADWEVFNYYFCLNGYYYAGLRGAGEALRDIGWDGADQILACAADLRDDILRAFHDVQSLAPVFQLRDGSWVPEYPTHAYAPSPIANFYAGEDSGRSWAYDVELGAHHLIPQGVMSPNSQDAAWMTNHMEDVQFLSDGWFYYPAEQNKADWFNLGGFAKVQPFYARTAEVHALRDDVRPFIRSYFNAVVSLLNREDLSLWEHFVNGAYNKTHETGYFLYQSRTVFVMERGDELWLAPFAATQWFEDGKSIMVSRVPTFFGPVSFETHSHVFEGYITAKIDPPRRNPPKTIVLRLRHPKGAAIRDVKVHGSNEFAVGYDRQTIRLCPEDAPISVEVRYKEREL